MKVMLGLSGLLLASGIVLACDTIESDEVKLSNDDNMIETNIEELKDCKDTILSSDDKTRQ